MSYESDNHAALLANLVAERQAATNNPELFAEIRQSNIANMIQFARNAQQGIQDIQLCVDYVDFKTVPRPLDERMRGMLDELYELSHARPEDATYFDWYTKTRQTFYAVKRIPTSGSWVIDEETLYTGSMPHDQRGMMGFQVWLRCVEHNDSE